MNNEAKSTQELMRQQQIVQQPEPVEPDVLAIIERRNEMISRILEYAIKSTHAGQWTNFDGKPFPTAAAAEVMARRCAVRIANVQTTKQPSQDDLGPFYIYIVTCVSSLPGDFDSIEAVGTCSSRDQFLGTETRQGRKLSEIDEGNILKAAYSNMTVNAVTRLLGVRNLTWERLRALGIDAAGAASVQHESGAKGGGKDAEEVLKFGSAKGKTLEQCTEEELAWYRKAWERDAADPEKAKWKDRTVKRIAAADAELGKRANGKAGTTQTKPVEASPWQRVVALAAGMPEKQLGELVRAATGKAKRNELTVEDVAKVQKALDESKSREPGEDI